ncbi:MAG: hypothetical protein DMD58_11335 [Gemmatimonadetes bacterium]|nr:MAG: hypothetical protein DMD58_11335 [Gemmatimonadota bacterium]
MHLFTRQVGTGPLVVVLHGGPGASHDYLLPQYDLLAQGRSLFYYDQRGGGRSPVPRDTPVGWREHVADLEELRVELALERLTLCGYSWGGLLAVLYFLEHPDRVERLALVAPAAITAEYRRQFEEEFARRMAAPEIQRERDALRASGLRERDPAASRSCAPCARHICTMRGVRRCYRWPASEFGPGVRPTRLSMRTCCTATSCNWKRTPVARPSTRASPSERACAELPCRKSGTRTSET